MLTFALAVLVTLAQAFSHEYVSFETSYKLAFGFCCHAEDSIVLRLRSLELENMFGDNENATEVLQGVFS